MRSLFDDQGGIEAFPIESIKPVRFKREECWELRFAKFHGANPHVYRALLALAKEARDAGIRKGSIKHLFGKLRWDYWMTTKGEEFKLNDAFHALYARLIAWRNPEFKDWFNFRKRRSDVPWEKTLRWVEEHEGQKAA